MQRAVWGEPCAWAIVEGTLFAVPMWGYSLEQSTTQLGGISVVSAHSISGYAILIGASKIDKAFRGNMKVPRSVSMRVMDFGRTYNFEDVLFSQPDTLPHYERCEAVYTDWIADEIDTENWNQNT